MQVIDKTIRVLNGNIGRHQAGFARSFSKRFRQRVTDYSRV